MKKFLTLQQKNASEQNNTLLTAKTLKSKKHHILQLIVRSILERE